MEQNMQGAQGVEPKKGKSKIGCWIAGCLTALVVFILFVGAIVGVAFWATKGPVKIVHAQLAYLRHGDLASAYEFTSGDFQTATNFEQFKIFIASNKTLAQNKSASFTSREIKNNRAFLEGSLTAVDGTKSPVKYELVKENETWKISYIEFGPRGAEYTKPEVSEAAPQTVTTVIEKVEVGTNRGPDGSITDAAINFPAGIKDIKISAYISGAKKGQKVNAVWYFGQQQITDAVTNVITDDGDFISQFYLGVPANGWPTGGYKVIVFIDDGKIKRETSYNIGR